jgi:predicted GH43/DUF377 family glycosyl hydrolase
MAALVVVVVHKVGDLPLRFFGWATPETIDNRGVLLFPEKIGGRFARLRRPIGFIDTDIGHGEEHPSIRISYSEDLHAWTEPETGMAFLCRQ